MGTNNFAIWLMGPWDSDTFSLCLMRFIFLPKFCEHCGFHYFLQICNVVVSLLILRKYICTPFYFLALPSFHSPEREEAENEVKNPWCLPDENVIKSQSTGFGELAGWWTHGCAGRVVCLDRAGSCSPSHIPCPRRLFYLMFIWILYRILLQ